jgi:hypothetical protein
MQEVEGGFRVQCVVTRPTVLLFLGMCHEVKYIRHLLCSVVERWQRTSERKNVVASEQLWTHNTCG